MQEVGGAIERVDYPDQSTSFQLRRQLLANDARSRLAREQNVHDDLLGSAVDLCHKIASAFQGPVGGTGRALDGSQIAAGASRRGLGNMN
jgi:hypothetical protein